MSAGLTASSGPSAPGVSELAEVLRVHEARWTTHGYERPYDVMHCLGDCEWRLRQKVGMDTEAMYAAHRRHVAEVIAASGVVVPVAEVREVESDDDWETLLDAAVEEMDEAQQQFGEHATFHDLARAALSVTPPPETNRLREQVRILMETCPENRVMTAIEAVAGCRCGCNAPRWDEDRIAKMLGANTPDRCGRCGEHLPNAEERDALHASWDRDAEWRREAEQRAAQLKAAVEALAAEWRQVADKEPDVNEVDSTLRCCADDLDAALARLAGEG